MLIYVKFTEAARLKGTGAQDGHLDFHTAPELEIRQIYTYSINSGQSKSGKRVPIPLIETIRSPADIYSRH